MLKERGKQQEAHQILAFLEPLFGSCFPLPCFNVVDKWSSSSLTSENSKYWKMELDEERWFFPMHLLNNLDVEKEGSTIL